MMNHFFKTTLAATCGLMLATGFASCSDDDDPAADPNGLTPKELALQAAATPYVNHTVLPTYKGMADAAVTLADSCAVIRDKFTAGTLTETDIRTAGETWKRSRKYWELSEAFLFGPANTRNIDPHIDSWPLDKNAMDKVLADIRGGGSWSIDNNGGTGLLGFHSIEYVLFELTADGTQSKPHAPATYTREELEFLVAVAEDLRDQCVLLEAAWGGMDALSPEKQAILEEAELEAKEREGWQMMNAGKPGSLYFTYQAVAEEIIQGCLDIVDEVGNTKIGRPHSSSTEEDRNYIESPYSLNSVEDFQDNIRSVRHSYCGSLAGDASISDYVKSVNPALDSEVRTAIDHAIATIGRIPEPFAKHATGSEAAAAMQACDELGTLLSKVMVEVTKQ